MPMLKETMLKRLLLPMVAAGGGGSAPVQDTATGNPLTFLTDLARPLKSLLIPFTTQQEGTGDPSPENVRPITGWTGVNVSHGGKNLFDFDASKIATVKNTSNNDRSAYLLGFTDCTLTFSASLKTEGDYTPTAINITKLKNGIAQTGASSFLNTNGAISTVTYTVGEGEYVCLLMEKNDNAEMAVNLQKYNIQIEVGSSATAYEAPHITETDISFPSSVYGGILDAVTGVLTVEWVGETYDGSDDENWNVESGNNFYIMTPSTFPRNTTDSVMICNTAKSMGSISTEGSCKITSSGNFNIKIGLLIDVSTVEGFKTWLSTNNVQVVVKLATPQEIQLTPSQITALVGNNTIWSDADGSMTAIYLKKG